MRGHVQVKSLPIATFLKHSGQDAAKHMIAGDRARAKKLLEGLHPHGPKLAHDHAFRTEVLAARRHHLKKSHAAQGDATTAPPSNGTSIDVTDAAVTYLAAVGVGSPAQTFNLLIDTGSSNTWVGAGTKYEPTSTSKSTGATVQVSYGSGSFSGNEFTDQVALGSNLTIQNQSIGVATTSQGFTGQDGILGIGPVDLTDGTLSTQQPIPTVTDNLFSQGSISSNSIGISYEPSTASPSTEDSPGVMNGELDFGGTDSDKFTGEITFVPITSTSPASNYWGIDQSITYGDSNTPILSQTAGIVDTGTTLLMIASDAFKKYEKATGGKMDSTTGLLTVTEAQFEKMQSLFFNIGGVNFELTANAQIWPRSLNSTLGGEEGKIYLIVSDIGNNSGSGLDFINGFGWLQRFYTVFDTQNSRVGVANTPFTDATTN